MIERDGSVDPKVRDILAESGLATQAFYRHFASKDELLLVILDDGRRQLADYLVHRMEKVRPKGPLAEVRAWILGILAQAADEGAAARTRPFTVGNSRLGERFPEEQAASVALLIDILAGAIGRAVDAGEIGRLDVSRSARFVYRVAVRGDGGPHPRRHQPHPGRHRRRRGLLPPRPRHPSRLTGTTERWLTGCGRPYEVSHLWFADRGGSPLRPAV